MIDPRSPSDPSEVTTDTVDESRFASIGLKTDPRVDPPITMSTRL
jgi:hypothetical protein